MNHVAVHMQKLKSTGAVRGHAKHNVREFSPSNVDAERSPDNYQLIEGVNTSDQLMADYRRRLEKVDKTIRKDAVRAVEIYVTGTPDQMHSLKRKDRDNYFKESLKYIQSVFGKENVLSAHVHMDEKTPHLHILATPVTKDGRLHLRSFIDGRKDLVHFQDKFGEIGKKYGLERGIRGSKKKHITQEQYSRILDGHIENFAPQKEFMETSGKFTKRNLEFYKRALNTVLTNAHTNNRKMGDYSKLVKAAGLHKVAPEDRDQVAAVVKELAQKYTQQRQQEQREARIKREKQLALQKEQRLYEKRQKALEQSQKPKKRKISRDRGGYSW